MSDDLTRLTELADADRRTFNYKRERFIIWVTHILGVLFGRGGDHAE